MTSVLVAEDILSEYEPIIGLEVHSQLQTQSKMFCGCAADYASAPPNTRVCPICLGMPGVLPVINRQAVLGTIMTALALHCEIPPYSKFDRKNYPYPDLMKGYQISQYDLPLSRNGWLEISVNGETRRIGVTRVHLEEDTAKLLHRVDQDGAPYSLLDVNRSGVPLMEIVGEPDLRSPEEAEAYLVKLRTILRYLGVSTGNMEEGSFRCDANISLRPRGRDLPLSALSKVEVKNMNSFRAVRSALEFEIPRQAAILGAGQRVPQETRGWVEERGETVSQRSKEQAHDYRYFPEPDLPPLLLDPAWIEQIRASLPELADSRQERFVQQYGLSAKDAEILTRDRALAEFFETAALSLARERAQNGMPGEAATSAAARAVSAWVLNDFLRLLNTADKEPGEAPITPDHIVELVRLVDQGQINSTVARGVFETLFATGERPGAIVAAQGLTQIADADKLAPIIDQVIAENPKPVADYRAGKVAALKALIGPVMRATRGQADSRTVEALLKGRLDNQDQGR